MFKSLFMACVFVGVLASSAFAQSVIHVYGPGGPAPAMQEAAEVFGRLHGVEVKVVPGPVDKWGADFQNDGDVIYSGAENMMSAFVDRFPTVIDTSSITPLYLRPAAILVRSGNPRHIHRFEDLLRPGVHVMVVEGAGQVGMWEDIAGMDGDIRTVRALRSNISQVAPNSADALKAWNNQPSLDAWIIFAIWAQAHPGVADVVPLSPHYRIYRDCGVALTQKGKRNASARDFVAFLESPEGRTIFVKHGWTDHAAKQ